MKKILIIALGMLAVAVFSCKNNENKAEDPALFDEEIAVEEGQEVWKSFGGTYFFWGDGEQLTVDFPLPQDGG